MKKIDLKNFEGLFSILKEKGYRIVGPTVQNGAIIYDDISGIDDLPVGITDEQAPGYYRLSENDNKTLFHYVVGPQSWKKFLYPPEQKLFTVTQNNNKLKIIPENNGTEKFAFIGVRACEISAIDILDRVLLGGDYTNSQYDTVRKNSLIIAVNCSKAEKNCFCTSMDTGPEVKAGYDIVLTEVFDDKDNHFFIAESGSDKGEEIISGLKLTDASDDETGLAKQVIENTRTEITKHLDTKNLKEKLQDNFESPVWDDIAKRCLACANCTMVCHTCFCMTVEDYTDLTKTKAERIQKWDSCFTQDFTYIHGGSVRVSTGSRYRQWITHKLSTWQDQFGTYGCTGCGRCITWCPVEIDLVEEANKIKHSSSNKIITSEER